WEESFGEWQENRHLRQRRDFLFGPIRRFEVWCDLEPEGSGTRLVFAADIECVGLIGLLAKATGLLANEGNKRFDAVERLERELDRRDRLPGSTEGASIRAASRRRFDTLGEDLARDPASHGLAPKLIDLLAHAPAASVRTLRPLALARRWDASP